MSSYLVNVFISHSWSYTGHYDKLAEWIFQEAWEYDNQPINFVDRSVPKDNPIHNARNTSELRGAIFDRIVRSDVVIIPTGMYSSYSRWIGEEIKGAQNFSKPILAVNPWGQIRRASIVVEAATESVGWSKDSVVQAVWRLVNS